VNGLGGTLFFTPGQIVLVIPAPRPAQTQPRTKFDRGAVLTTTASLPTVVRLRFQAADPVPEITGLDRLPGIVNYFLGNDPSKWHSNLPTYAGIAYRELYPGIDLNYEGLDGLLKAT